MDTPCDEKFSFDGSYNKSIYIALLEKNGV